MNELHSQALQIRILTGMISKLAGQDLERRLQAGGLDVSMPQVAVLRRIQGGSSTISELSGEMLLTPASLVPVVDALERKGLLRRGPDAEDRRRKSLALTPSGQALLTRLPALREDDAVARGLARMRPEQTAQLTCLLRDLACSLVGDRDLVDRALAASGSSVLS